MPDSQFDNILNSTLSQETEPIKTIIPPYRKHYKNGTSQKAIFVWHLVWKSPALVSRLAQERCEPYHGQGFKHKDAKPC